MAETRSSQRVSRWIPLLGILLCLVGIGVATYLTISHYTTQVTLACPDTGVINCTKVTTSSYSAILGMPLALLGLIFFVVMLPLQLPAAWRSSSPLLRLGRLLFSISGVGMVFWLVYVELFRLNAICLYCTAVHALTVILFFVTTIGTAGSELVVTSGAPEGRDQSQ